MPWAPAAELRAAASRWVAAFRDAVVNNDVGMVTDRFCRDGNWRDLLAFTWSLHTYYGTEQVRAGMQAALQRTTVRDVELAESVPPRLVTRAGRAAIEALFTFETGVGHGRGVVRLDPASVAGEPRAFTVLTALAELRSAPELDRDSVDYSRRFGAPNWLDLRRETIAFTDSDPAVLIVGGGQAGIATAARLGQMGVDTLVVDRNQRIGDNWRNRYHSLVLHNEIWVNHLPYLPFPATWPTYVPKDKLANWFEAYVESMEINFWTETEFLGATYDTTRQKWHARLRQGRAEREVRPRHIVLATGVSGIPNWPELPGLDMFSGTTIHSSEFTDGSPFAGRRVLVLGSGNSGHDVAQELHSCGATVTMVQRGPTTIASVGPDAAGRFYSLYREGPGTEDCDLLSASIPYPALCRAHQLLTADLLEHDACLIEGLERAGFQTDIGADGTGYMMKYLRRGGGYYLNVGCSELIIEGSVRLLQNSAIKTFGPHGVELVDGTEINLDAVVLATGYRPQRELVCKLFGDEVAERVGSVWGFDDEGELQNMWRRTRQDGLWFIAGSLAQCRIFSQYLALQIRACQDGLIDPVADDQFPRGVLRPQDFVDLATAATR